MPTHLCHGFRWTRAAIRIFVAKYDVEDATAEWLLRPATSAAILRTIYDLHPHLPAVGDLGKFASNNDDNDNNDDDEEDDGYTSDITITVTEPDARPSSSSSSDDYDDDEDTDTPWSAIHLLEEYDPRNQTLASQPHAFVADRIIRVPLSINVAAEMARYAADVATLPADKRPVKLANLPNTCPPLSDSPPPTPQSATSELAAEMGAFTLHAATGVGDENAKGWFEKLRDSLENDAEIGWFVVSCGDEEREWCDDASSRGDVDMDVDVEYYYDDDGKRQVRSERDRWVFEELRRRYEEKCAAEKAAMGGGALAGSL